MPPALGKEFLTTGPPGKSLKQSLCVLKFDNCILDLGWPIMAHGQMWSAACFYAACELQIGFMKEE